MPTTVLRWYLLCATVECRVLPAIISSVSNALAIASSELAIASSSQIALLAEGDVAPLLGLIIVEGVAFLVSTALVEAIEGGVAVSKTRIGSDIKVAEPVVGFGGVGGYVSDCM